MGKNPASSVQAPGRAVQSFNADSLAPRETNQYHQALVLRPGRAPGGSTKGTRPPKTVPRGTSDPRKPLTPPQGGFPEEVTGSQLRESSCPPEDWRGLPGWTEAGGTTCSASPCCQGNYFQCSLSSSKVSPCG